MKMQGLSLETIPPIHIPFRFFLTAPWMGIVAGLALLLGSDQAFSSQWTPELRAVTHLLTLGFMAMVMLGAMFQLVPVISGHLIPGGTKVAGLVHVLLSVGVLLLVAGFYWQAYALMGWAALLLLLAFAVFLLALATLLRHRIGGDSIFSIRFAALALLTTVGLGLWLSASYAGLTTPPALANKATVHMAWGIGGWVLLLVMGASYQVIPMFHVTPSYPSLLARGLPTTVFVSLLTLTLVQLPEVQALAVLAFCAAAMTYAIFSIHLLGQRKRKLADITARFWRLSLVCLLLSALLATGLYFTDDPLPSPGIRHQLQVVLGTLMIYGFAISVIMGMLQKIVPFLSYLHLQRSCLSNFALLKTLPHIGEIIPASRSRWQFNLHIAALLTLLAGITTDQATTPAAILVTADFAWLSFSLISATALYHNTAQRITSSGG